MDDTSGDTQSNKEPNKSLAALSLSEKLDRGQEYKEEGNALFREERVKAAMGKYHRCLLFVRGAEEHSRPEYMVNPNNAKLPLQLQQRANQLKLDCYNNLAACLLKLEDSNMRRVILYCDNVLALSPNNAKAMYRKGVAYYNLSDFDTALGIFQEAKQHAQKSDASINVYLELCHKAIEEYKEREKKTYHKLFA